MPNAHREVAVEMKASADKWCIIAIKGQGDVRVSLFTLTRVTDAGGWPFHPGIVTLKPGVIRLRSFFKRSILMYWKLHLCCTKPHYVI